MHLVHVYSVVSCRPECAQLQLYAYASSDAARCQAEEADACGLHSHHGPYALARAGIDARDCLTASSTPSLVANAPTMIFVSKPAALLSSCTPSFNPAQARQQRESPAWDSSNMLHGVCSCKAPLAWAESAQAIHCQVDLIRQGCWGSVHIVILLQVAGVTA